MNPPKHYFGEKEMDENDVLDIGYSSEDSDLAEFSDDDLKELD